ncbi:hypothetical protein QE152_g10106 [Popillia japonica]|uniref:Uncharacterized protein n=1 Tax=Popillia japonica TaxID=7064 RepID=A0AAW1LSH0_POPJA
MVKAKTTANQIMDAPRQTYLKSSVASQVQLQRKIRNMQFKGKHSLNKYILEFEKTVTELKNAGGKVDDVEVISQLLASMPDQYQSVVAALDILFSQANSTVTLDFVKSKLLSEEQRLKKTYKNEDSSAVFIPRIESYK